MQVWIKWGREKKKKEQKKREKKCEGGSRMVGNKRKRM